MKKISDILPAEDPQSLIGLSKSTPKESRRDELKNERLMDRLWERLQEIYGHQLNSQFGETMPESWERLLKGISPEQIRDGLNAIASRKDTWPPNAVEFRQLCLPDTISPDGGNTAAYLTFSDPRHPRNDPNSPEYVKPQSKLIEHVSKTKQTGKDALKGILNDFD